MGECKGHIKLFFIRHGFSCANYSNRKSLIPIHSIMLDPQLSNAGIKDLKQYKNQYNFIKPDYVFSSNLLRAIQTAQYLFPDKKVYVSPYIGEHGIGRDNRPSKPSMQRKYLPNADNVVYAYLGEGGGKRSTELELDKKFDSRLSDYDIPNFRKFLDWLNTKIPPGKDITIVVVGHSNFMRKMMIEKGILDPNVHKLKNSQGGKIRNAGVVEINLCRRYMVVSKKETTELYPYTETCPPIKTFVPNAESIDNYPCYGVRLLGIPEPDIKRRNFKNC